MRLAEGKRKYIKPSHLNKSINDCIKVIAHCEDFETPYIELETPENITVLTDVETVELIRMLNKALSILPSSK